MQRLLTGRLVYKIRLRQFAEASFPLKVKPLKDELLSSWLISMALEHKTSPATFTNLYLPETKNKLWASDVDLQADDDLLVRLSLKAALPVETLRSMTFKAYEGILFETLYPDTGGTPFLLKLSMRGRWSRFPGVRWCPQCLAEDERPYFRKEWRLSVFTACTKHRRQLMDRCVCGAMLTLYKAKWGDNEVSCPKCSISFKDVAFKQISVSEDVIEAQGKIQEIMRDGYVMLGDVPVYSHLYFSVLHQILKLMISRKYGTRINKGVGIAPEVYTKRAAFETVPLHIQSNLMHNAMRLLSDDWPKRFIDICESQKLYSSALLRDLEQAPFWYWRVVTDRLFHPDKVLTLEEIKEAANYMIHHEMAVSKLSLSKMLGVRQIFRKRNFQ